MKRLGYNRSCRCGRSLRLWDYWCLIGVNLDWWNYSGNLSFNLWNLEGRFLGSGFAGHDLVEEDDADELPPLNWLGNMCLGSDTISYLNLPLMSPLAPTPSGVL
jgi:hypothetical protein